MGTIHQHPSALAPVERVLAAFDRNQLAGFIEVAIGLLDLADGDPDLEPNGDELDGTGGEDDFVDYEGNGPGCPVSDPGGDPLDKGEMGDGPLYATLPVYGIDQRKGPTNEVTAHRAHLEAILRGRLESERIGPLLNHGRL